MALPQNFFPLWQMLVWDMSRGVSADCCLSEAQWCHHQHGLDKNQVAVVHFINSSAVVQFRNRCDLVMQAWQQWHSTIESGKPVTVLLKLMNREPSPDFPPPMSNGAVKTEERVGSIIAHLPKDTVWKAMPPPHVYMKWGRCNEAIWRTSLAATHTPCNITCLMPRSLSYH